MLNVECELNVFNIDKHLFCHLKSDFFKIIQHLAFKIQHNKKSFISFARP